MTYDLDVYFSGICYFNIKQGTSTTADVLFANATPRNRNYGRIVDAKPATHRVAIAIDARNLVAVGSKSWPPDEIVSSPDGRDIALFIIKNRKLTLVVPGGERLRIKRGTFRKPHPFYTDRSDRPFDWLPDVRKMDRRIGDLVSGALGDCDPIGAILSLNNGDLRCFDLSRRRSRWLDFSFRTTVNDPPKYARETLDDRAIVDRMVLRNKRLTEAARIESDDGLIIGIGEEDPSNVGETSSVSISVSHLEPDYQPPREAAFDFLWFYTMFNWDEEPAIGELVVPWPVAYREAGRTPSSGLCPPGM